ncbi:MAG: hypothetical protein Q9201_001000 [Fulgogasparrea decipioides]
MHRNTRPLADLHPRSCLEHPKEKKVLETIHKQNFEHSMLDHVEMAEFDVLWARTPTRPVQEGISFEYPSRREYGFPFQCHDEQIEKHVRLLERAPDLQQALAVHRASRYRKVVLFDQGEQLHRPKAGVPVERK